MQHNAHDLRRLTLLLAAEAEVDVRTAALALREGTAGVRRGLTRSRVIDGALRLGISLPVAATSVSGPKA